MSKLISRIVWVFLVAIAGQFSSAFANSAKPIMSMDLHIPKISADPYHRPYVAVWLETRDREPVATLAVWHEKDTWLKDLRQWWRKVGRSGRALDSVSGATRRPGIYTIEWDGATLSNTQVTAGEYLLNIETSREEGGRSYVRQPISIGSDATIALPAQEEFGATVVHLRSILD